MCRTDILCSLSSHLLQPHGLASLSLEELSDLMLLRKEGWGGGWGEHVQDDQVEWGDYQRAHSLAIYPGIFSLLSNLFPRGKFFYLCLSKICMLL